MAMTSKEETIMNASADAAIASGIYLMRITD